MLVDRGGENKVLGWVRSEHSDPLLLVVALGVGSGFVADGHPATLVQPVLDPPDHGISPIARSRQASLRVSTSMPQAKP